MKLTTDDRAALQGAMNVLMEILQHTPPGGTQYGPRVA